MTVQEEAVSAAPHIIVLGKDPEDRENAVPPMIVQEEVVSAAHPMIVQEEAVSAAHHTTVLAHSLWKILN